MDEIQDMLSHEANKQILGCEAENSCLAEIAGALGVDDLVTGKLSAAAESHVILVRRIDQRRAKVAGTVSRRLKAGSGQEFLLAVGPAVEELFPGRPLKGGASRGVADEVALRLDPPPLPAWSFWTTSTGAILAGLGVGVFALLTQDAQKDYRAYANASTTSVLPGDQLVTKGNRMQSYADTTNGIAVGAGVLALGSAVMYLFTDFEGYGDKL